MTNNNSQSGIGGIADILLVCMNFLFGLFIIYFLIILFAPLMDGKSITILEFLSFAYWFGFYFITRYFLIKMQKKIRLKNYKYILIGLYYALCLVNSFSILSISFTILWLALYMVSIKKEINSWTVNVPVGDEAPNKALQ